MTRGRPPQNPILTSLHRSRPGGGRQKHVHNFVPLVSPPDYLTEAEKKRFQQIVQDSPYGLLTSIDSLMLTVLVQHAELHERAYRELAELYLETGSGSVKTHPLVMICQSQAKILIALADSLGLSALTRQRIKLPTAPADPDGFWAGLEDRKQ